MDFGVGRGILNFLLPRFFHIFRRYLDYRGMAQLVRAGSFFIPLSIGTLEGGKVLIFSALGYPGSLGLAATLIGRVKQFTPASHPRINPPRVVYVL